MENQVELELLLAVFIISTDAVGSFLEGSIQYAALDPLITNFDGPNAPDNRTAVGIGDRVSLTFEMRRQRYHAGRLYFSMVLVTFLKNGVPYRRAHWKGRLRNIYGDLAVNLTFTFQESDAGVFQCFFHDMTLGTMLMTIPIRLDYGNLPYCRNSLIQTLWDRFYRD